jgi:hypothetical protein
LVIHGLYALLTLYLSGTEIRDWSLFMEGGRGFFLSNIFKIESPSLKEQKFNDDPPSTY